MSYTKTSYSDFKEYKIRRIENSGIKQFIWDPVTVVKILDEQDDVTRIQKVTNKVMPFDVYLIPRSSASKWDTYAKNKQIANTVYLLFGRDFIYAGKSINADRIQSHKMDESKEAFDYQMIFAPNNGNTNTQYYWVKDFMEYLECLLISRIKDSEYCKNKIDGKSEAKCNRDLNMNKDKEDFANNIIDLIIDSFLDISCFSYLIPQSNIDEDEEIETEEESSATGIQKKQDPSNPITAFWIKFIKYNQANNGPFKSHDVSRLMANHWISANSIKGIPKSSVNCCLSRAESRVELYTDGGTKDENKAIFDAIFARKEEIENSLGITLKWERLDEKKACRISCRKSLSYLENDDQEELFSFLVEYTNKFFEVFGGLKDLFA